MSFSAEVWRQLKSVTADRICKALIQDGWEEEGRSRGTRAFAKRSTNGSGRRRRLVIHYHPGKTYGPRLLRALLADAGWSERDLERLGLIKKKR